MNEDKIKAALLAALKEFTNFHDCEGSIVNRLYAAIAAAMAAQWSNAKPIPKQLQLFA